MGDNIRDKKRPGKAEAYTTIYWYVANQLDTILGVCLITENIFIRSFNNNIQVVVWNSVISISYQIHVGSIIQAV